MKVNKKRKALVKCEERQNSDGLWLKSYFIDSKDSEFDYIQCMTRSYTLWTNMLKRIDNRGPKSYDGCISLFKDYQHFANWCNNEHGFRNSDGIVYWTLDKDLMLVGNKTYSPENCCFIPRALNSAITFKTGVRSLPIGVYSAPSGNYISLHGNKGESIYLGTFETPLQAHQAWQHYRINFLENFIDYPNLGSKAKIGICHQIDKILSDSFKNRITERGLK